MALEKVVWIGSGITHVEVWRVLDLSGLSSSPRNSHKYVKSGYVYLNDNLVNLKTKVEVAAEFTLEIRFPTGLTKTKTLMVIEKLCRTNHPYRL